MNNDTPADAITVTQADRDLVYDLMLPLATNVVEHKALDYIKQGQGDDAEAVQLAARHRTTSLAAQDGLVERVARAMYEDRASECPNPIPWDCTSSQDIWFKQARAALASIEVKS